MSVLSLGGREVVDCAVSRRRGVRVVVIIVVDVVLTVAIEELREASVTLYRVAECTGRGHGRGIAG